MNQNSKSAWNDIKHVWGRIAAVLVAVSTLATVITQVFHTKPELTYSILISMGFILLVVSFYVDKQTCYTHEEFLKYEKEAHDVLNKAIEHQKEMQTEYKKDTDARLESFKDDVNKLIRVSKETRKDSLRIQLLIILQHQPENIDTILKLAETYFVDLHGDWYMTNEFKKWAKEHNVEIPLVINNIINE